MLKGAFADIVEYEKIFLIQRENRFFGALLMDLDIEINFSQRGATDLHINKSPMSLSINPIFCSKYTFPEFTGLIIEELMKMVYMHPAAYSKMNKEKDGKKHTLLEKSSDAAAASILKRDVRLDTSDAGGCRLPGDAYTPTSVNNECNIHSAEGMPLEYYYGILKKFQKNDPGGNSPQNIKQQGSNQNQGNSSQGQGSGQNGQNIATPGNSQGDQCHDWEGGDDEDTKEKIKSLVSEAFNSLSEKSRGLLSGGIGDQIKELLAPPKINWKQILKKMLGSVPVPYEKTHRRLNRRQPYRSDLCGRVFKRTVNIICAFDTSGSMSDQDIAYCMNEVFNILKSYSGYKVTVVECDAEVQKVYTVKRPHDVQRKVFGRGGTSFQPVIDYINGEGNYKNSKKWPSAGHYRDALLVYFTDGFGDDEITKPKTYRNLWVVMEDAKNLSLKNPYGDVKSLAEDADYKKFKQGM